MTIYWNGRKQPNYRAINKSIKDKRNNMKPFILSVFFILCSISSTFARENEKIIKATNQRVAIKDGSEGKTNYWNYLINKSSPIVYHLAKNGIERQVTFYTDIDSVSFDVHNEADYPFKVVLNNSDTFFVILSTKNQGYTRTTNKGSGIDTLAFTFNKNKQIILPGKINNGQQIDFCFDLGARMVYVIGNGFDKTNNLIIDGKMEDESVTGLSIEKTSSNNSLQLGNLNFDHIQICYIDEAGFLENGGALLGFNLFQNNVLEIDFDHKLLMIHPNLPDKISTYSSIEFKQTTGGLYVPISIHNGHKAITGWYFFDTGADNNLTIDARFAKRENLTNTMKQIGKAGIASSENRMIEAAVLEVPHVTIANYDLINVPTLLADESNAESEFEDGVIGIGLQSRFNFIIDYPNNRMYLKPGKYFNDSFKAKVDKSMNRIIGLCIASFLLIGSLVIYKRRKATRNTMFS